MTEPKETTMTTTKRNRDISNAERQAGTPNLKDKKAPRSILKGIILAENEEEMKKKDEKGETENETTNPPIAGQIKEADKEETTNHLGFTLKKTNNSEESTAKNIKNQGGNDEVKNNNEDSAPKEDQEDKISKNDNENEDKKQDVKYDSTTDNTDNKEGEKQKENNQASEEGKDTKNDNEDIDKMDEDKCCLDLHEAGYKQHTSEWHSIPEGVLKNSVKLTKEDEDYINDIIEDIAVETDTHVDTMDKDKWIKLFIKTKEISAARNKKRFIRIFGVSMARSNPEELFSQDIFDGNRLLETKITVIWAAAYTLYGPGWLNATIALAT
jgi:hypothetical protein